MRSPVAVVVFALALCCLVSRCACTDVVAPPANCSTTAEQRGLELASALQNLEFDAFESLLSDSCTTLTAANWRDDAGNGLYHLAVALASLDDRIRALSLLGEYRNININFLNQQRKAPLHIAVLNDDVESATLLILAGADVMVASDEGSALLLAKMKGSEDMYKLLRRRFFHAKRSEANSRQPASQPEVRTDDIQV